MNFPFYETAVGIYLHYCHRGEAAHSAKAYAIWRTEVAEAVEDYVVVIKLGGTRHVRSVAIHHIGTGVYSCMGKLHHIPSVFSKSRFRGIGNVAVFGTFAAAVEADYDNVRVLLEV